LRFLLEDPTFDVVEVWVKRVPVAVIAAWIGHKDASLTTVCMLTRSLPHCKTPERV
jgi:hypothetical protein